jgi:hypothetical protein
VPRLAAALAEGVRGAEFQTLLQRIDRSPFHQASEVKIYAHGLDAFAAMAAAVQAAQREVLLESYIFKDDRLGKAAAAWQSRCSPMRSARGAPARRSGATSASTASRSASFTPW